MVVILGLSLGGRKGMLVFIVPLILLLFLGVVASRGLVKVCEAGDLFHVHVLQF